MKQVWHIFRKDVRHYWREGAVSILLMAAFAWNEMRRWNPADAYVFGFNRFLSTGLPIILLMLSWWLVVARVVQGESLVGDRQFWITRPYEWKKLLAAKVLFVLLFVNLPLLIADVFLLARAGFMPGAYVRGLLWMQVPILLFLLLPVAALATVTATVVQMLLALLAIALYMIGIAALSSEIPSADFSSGTEDLQGAVLIGTCLAVLMWQYHQRRTLRSRWVLGGAAVVVLFMIVVTPYRQLVAREYPQFDASRGLPLRLELRPIETPVTREDYYDGNDVEIQIPLNVSGVANESIVRVNGVMSVIESPAGPRWDTGWQSNGVTLFPGQKRTEITLNLKRKIYDRIKMLPVRIRLSLALTVFLDKDQQKFVVPRGEFVMPGVGRCAVRSEYTNLIHCRSALRQPASLLVTTDISETTCPATQFDDALAAHGTMAHDWNSNADSGPEFSSVQSFDLNPTVDDRYGDSGPSARGICRGTPLILSRPEFLQRGRIELEFNGLRLLDYRGGIGQLGPIVLRGR